MQFRFDGDETVMILDDRIGRGQTEPGAFWFGGKIRIENPLQIILGNSNALVADADANVIAGRQVGYDGSVIAVVGKIIAADAQSSAVRHGLIGIHNEVA